MLKRITSLLLSVVIVFSVLYCGSVTVFASNKEGTILSLDEVDFSKIPSQRFVDKIKDTINGSEKFIYYDMSRNRPVDTTVGKYTVPDNDVNLYVHCWNNNRNYSGTSCYIYANGLYNCLFNDYPSYCRNESISIGGRGKNTDYSFFTDNAERIFPGSFLCFGSHYGILLYSTSKGIVYVDGNGDGNGLIAIRYRTWSQINNSYSGLSYVVSPKPTQYYKFYPFVNFADAQSADFTVKVNKESCALREGPYLECNEIRRASKDESFHIKGKYFNTRDHWWYLTDEGYWIWDQNVQKVDYYTIKYNADGGSNCPASQTKKKGQSITLSDKKPTKKGYIFIGWVGGNITYTAGSKYTKDESVTLKAKWQKESISLKVDKTSISMCVNGSNPNGSIKVTASGWFTGKLTLKIVSSKPDVVKPSSQDFATSTGLVQETISKSINLTSLAPGDSNLDFEVYNKSGELVARQSVWATVDKVYSVKFYKNSSGSVSKTQEKHHFKDLLLAPDFIPEYTDKTKVFVGWSKNQNGSTLDYGPGDLYKTNSDLNLYAVWENVAIVVGDYSGNVLTLSGNGAMPNYKDMCSEWQQYASSCKKIVVNSGITTIGAYAFEGFSVLEEVNLGSSVKIIGPCAFSNCKKLTTVTHCGITQYGYKAFSNCPLIPNMGVNISKGNANEEITIGSYAFENCTSLTALNISGKVTDIGISAFTGCTGITSLTIDEGVTAIGESAFSNCSGLIDIDLPESLDVIGESAFSGCTSLQNTGIDSDIEHLGDYAYAGCTSLKSVDLSDVSIEGLGVGAFANCTSLETVSLPENTLTLSDSLFSGCTSLRSVEGSENLVDYGDSTFYFCTSLQSVPQSSNVLTIGSSTFFGCTSLKEVDLPNELSDVGDFAFYHCTSLETVESDGVYSIGQYAFAECTSLKDFDTPPTLGEIGNAAFAGCTSLNNLQFANEPISFGDQVFYGCTSLTNMVLPESTLSVGNDVFGGCSDELKVSCYSTCAALNSITSDNDNCTIIYPVESLSFETDEMDLIVGSSLILNPVFNPIESTNKNVIWHSDNEDVAIVTDGIVTAVSSGTANIIAFSEDGGFKAECLVNCSIPVEGITFEVESSRFYVGSEYHLDYSFKPISPSNIDVTFSSSNPDVAYVDEDGDLLVVSAGNTVISVTTVDGNYSDEIAVNAENYIPIEKIELTSDLSTVILGQSIRCNVSYEPSNASSPNYIIYSDNDDVISVDDENKTITAIGLGKANISIYGDETSAFYEITVVKEKYSVKWNVDGVETMQEYEPGATIQKPADPQKEGYIFKGWTPAVPDTMPAEDITFTAVFDVDPTADNLTIAKSDAKTIIDNTVPVGASDDVIAIANETKAEIDAATDETSVQAIAESGIAAINAQIQKEQDEAAAQALTEAKATAKSEIDALASGKSAAVQTIANTVKQNIDSAVDIAGVTTAKQNGIKAINDQIAKENKPDDPVNPTANAKLNVKSSASVDYRANVTITATATGVPDGYVLALYDGNTKIATGDNTKVSHNVGNMTASKTYTVKVIDPSNNAVQKDDNGAELSKTCEINVNTGFFARLIAFFRGLFGLLPKVEIRP